MDRKFMLRAAELAQKASDIGEVPVGAVIVKDGKIIGEGFNTRETEHDVLGHAEVNAVREAQNSLGDWRLDGCTLYVTLEPCPMCAGLILNSRISETVFGAYDMNGGAMGSVANLPEQFGVQCQVYGGIEENRCAAFLRDFFRKKQYNINKK